ncbi:hypothetical protein B5X24_HaOG203055 [Helicoverpa armigera]|uniref:Uncharacterized protein n=1 Tax=Helicoverpa armigera TaxID=29058 RepID=A0A2W1BRM5_HELAM|nr:hypothetical protein B5X24_HaOG203055 [Helicoverpa armigera]
MWTHPYASDQFWMNEVATDHALPVGPASPAHSPVTTYPPSRAANPALATPLWSANEGKPRGGRPIPRHASL